MRTFETPALLQKFRASHNTVNIISNIISTGFGAGLSGLNSILYVRFGYVGQLESQLKGFGSFSVQERFKFANRLMCLKSAHKTVA